jgi:hypothetical protein
MATLSKPLYGTVDSTVFIELLYNDAFNPPRATDLHVVNNSGGAIWAEVRRTSDGLQYGSRFGPGETTINIPTGPAGRIDLTPGPRPGTFLGFSFSVQDNYP